MSRREISTFGRLGLATIAALALAAFCLAPSASAANGSISGKVTFAGGGEPVLGAEVCAESETDFECAPSQADGTYVLPALAPGSYFVSFESSEASPYVVFQAYPTKVTVASGTPSPGVNAAVVKGGAIAGTVTDASSGLPIAEVDVCAWSETDEELDGCGSTASNGTFKVTGIRPGPHEIEFFKEVGYEPQLFHSIPISAGVTINSEAHLVREEGRISGNVYTAANHTPLAGITVCAIWAEFHETGGCVPTDSSGAYEFFPVPPGQFKIVYSPEPAEVEFNSRASSDVWPTQYWNLKPTLAAADTLNVTRTSTFAGIDGLLGPGPTSQSPGGSTTPPATVTPTPVKVSPPKSQPCPKGKVKKTVKGKTSCVKRHKRHHHRRHHRKHHQR